ncbi:MAG: lactonase family protein [Provencibacterium sp.]|jgi:6-phosphogluconolactonase|nr:lactonase family protein [Provencibacterium sp.]
MEICYIGSYTHSGGEGILRLEYDPDTGHLSPLQTAAKAEEPSWLIQAQGLLLSVSETDHFAAGGQGGVLAWLPQADGTLKQTGQAESGGSFPCHLCYSSRHRLVFAANYGSGTVGVLRLSPEGSLTLAGTLTLHGSGPRPQQAGPHAHCCLLSQAQDRLFVCDLGADRVHLYSLKDGALPSPLPENILLPPGSGPRHAVLSPDEKQLFILCELSCMLHVWDFESRRFSAGLPVADLPDGAFAAAAALHPRQDGRQLAASCREADALHLFTRKEDGSLSGHIAEPCGRWPRDFGFCPADESAALLAFERDHTLQLWRWESELKKYPPISCSSPVCVCWWKKR